MLEKATQEVTIVDPWDGQACLDYLKDLQPSQIFLLNTHQHHDHIRGNEQLLRAGARLQRKSFFEEWPLPGHTCEHVVFLLRDQTEHLFCGDTLFQAGVGNCKGGGDPHALYESVEWLKANLKPQTLLHVGHDYFRKNILFALQFEPDNSKLTDSLATLEVQEGFQLPPHSWAQEMDINPFLRLSETALRQGLKKLDNSEGSDLLTDKDVFIKLRSLRDHF